MRTRTEVLAFQGARTGWALSRMEPRAFLGARMGWALLRTGARHTRGHAHSLRQMSPTGLVSMLFIGAISTCIAYWLWGRLLRDYTAAQVVPFALLVPFVGAAASSLVFGETFGPLRLAGMITVVGGIAVMLLSKRSQALPKIA